ncbi:MAG: hypothetical protein IJ122_06185 [Methanobrevibacter sp.]|nr:hypothetical protein [Methanobrevibacter sp.]
MERFNILLEIDCDPMNRHQEEFGKYIFNRILSQEYQKPNFTVFGNWGWYITVNEEEQTKIKEFLTRQYDAGNLRYAGWGKQEEDK